MRIRRRKINAYQTKMGAAQRQVGLLANPASTHAVAVIKIKKPRTESAGHLLNPICLERKAQFRVTAPSATHAHVALRT